ncbi:hypothetical protein LZ554_002452 [Drepanopeziza brunnea f. sp. 'monogermtubi']|nr:hypothetical protein LZ554_002452 [Drepanopeziza brunnea f. sp. 'monogermtubi']
MSCGRGDGLRGNFSSSYGRFYAEPEHVERVTGSSLRSMFIPRLTPHAQILMGQSYSGGFVRGQLKHYGVQFDTSEISGNGILLMKKVIQAGKCDKVPDHIAELRVQMHTEWLDSVTPERISECPELVMEKYFLSSGQPDRTKTTTVIGIPQNLRSSYRADNIRDAANKVAGLHHETGWGPTTQTIFLGWDPVAVNKAAKGHYAKEENALKAVEDKRAHEREALHAGYLESKTGNGSKGSKSPSPVGSYIIDCEVIEKGYLERTEDLSLEIRQTKEPGVFEADFDFGILEGMMIMSTEENILEQYCSQLDRDAGAEEEDDSEEDEEDEDDDRKPTASSKRKAGASTGRGRPKKSKVEASLTYVVRLKFREMAEGEVHYTAEKGTIQFDGKSLVSFDGKVDLPCVGEDVPFTARKISDSPASSGRVWADYSESAYEYARVGRWH